jgi:hypothetical protein
VRKTTAVLAGLLLAVLAAAPVSAAWGGQPDGDQHPMVGAMFFDWDASGGISDWELSCSGSYAGVSRDGRNDVFLTAGHCVAPMAAFGSPPAYVSFDNDLVAGGISGLITAEGYAWDPAFGHDAGDMHDLGVVLLPLGSVSGIEPVVLPPAGFMDDLLQRAALKDLDVEAVGYGAIPMWQQRGGTQFGWPGTRNMATVNIKGLTKADILYNQNANATGDGGVCFGDSGSPQFIAGDRTVISVTSGGDGNCRAHNHDYRLDTPQARSFLGQFLVLP